MKPPNKLLYFSQYSSGGLADYAHEQANALQTAGVKVCFLTTPDGAQAKRTFRYDCRPTLMSEPSRDSHPSRIARRLRTMRCITGNMRVLAKLAREEGFSHVLLGAYFEYFAPLWASPLRQLARQGTVFGSVIHDPVRQTRIGPRWWHRHSIGSAYSFLSEAFVHDPVELDTVRLVKDLQTTVIPHGPYQFPQATLSRETMRQQLTIPSHACLMLAFGHLRDAKNLDLVIRAMVLNPDTYLLVAGRELSASQRPAAYYQQLASQLGVAERCRWRTGFLPEDEVGNLFEASDLVLLTYNRSFRSASGVLNVAVQYRKPCLASGGAGNLKTSVARYGLGLWIEPDCAVTLAAGLSKWRGSSWRPDWTGYERDNSWERNAELILQRFASRNGSRHGEAWNPK